MAVQAVLQFGNPLVFEGYFSELLQHEIDHIDGVLFIDHITRPEAITMAREWDPANATP